jgi:hypothetical protein
MGIANAMFFRAYSGIQNIYRFQNYEVDTNVDGYDYAPFQTSEIVTSTTGDQGSLTVEFPYTQFYRTKVEIIALYSLLVEVQLYTFDPLTGSSINSARSLIATYQGQAMSGTLGPPRLTLELGSVLSPVGAQMPPLLATTSLIGDPCKV